MRDVAPSGAVRHKQALPCPVATGMAQDSRAVQYCWAGSGPLATMTVGVRLGASIGGPLRRPGGMDMIAPGLARPPVRNRLAALAAGLIVALPLAMTVLAPAALATTTGIDVTLPLGHRIQGIVSDHDGHPIEGAEVFASSIVNAGDARDTTDATGHYVLHALPDSTYHVHVDPPHDSNFLEQWYGAPDSNPEGIGAVDVIVEGANVTGIDVQLEAGNVHALRGAARRIGLPVRAIGRRTRRWSRRRWDSGDARGGRRGRRRRGALRRPPHQRECDRGASGPDRGDSDRRDVCSSNGRRRRRLRHPRLAPGFVPASLPSAHRWHPDGRGRIPARGV